MLYTCLLCVNMLLYWWLKCKGKDQGFLLPFIISEILTLLVLWESDAVFLPVHVYTPSCVGYWASTMCSVEIILPIVTRLLRDDKEASVIISVWLNWVFWLLRVQVIAGTGPPIELQEMLMLPLSRTNNLSICPVVVVGNTIYVNKMLS